MAYQTEAQRNSETIKLLMQIVGVVFFSFFLLISVFIYKKYDAKYKIKNADIRVYDSWQCFRYIGKGALAVILPVLVLLGAIASHIDNQYVPTTKEFMINTFLIVLAFILTAIAITCAARAATTYIGTLIYKDKNIFVIPCDLHNNSISENYVQQKWFFDLLKMEELPISGITKITRESGKKLFVHGNFGTRCIEWNDKQKRDECIAALEMACGKKLSSFDQGDLI